MRVSLFPSPAPEAEMDLFAGWRCLRVVPCWPSVILAPVQKAVTGAAMQNLDRPNVSTGGMHGAHQAGDRPDLELARLLKNIAGLQVATKAANACLGLALPHVQDRQWGDGRCLKVPLRSAVRRGYKMSQHMAVTIITTTTT